MMISDNTKSAYMMINGNTKSAYDMMIVERRAEAIIWGEFEQ